MEYGAAGLVVSSPGGHALDQALATADMLTEVVRAVDGRIDVLPDGGIRSGADVPCALGLGARALVMGRPARSGLTVAGADGVSRVVRLLRKELEVTMAMCGARRVGEIGQSMVAPRCSCRGTSCPAPSDPAGPVSG
jgi:4-hydroxymandelate oxidase